jgi:pyrimidine-nucleoside phosphorylase
MSKKLASGADALVMDVKSGNGAFMKNDEEARALAESLVRTGEAMGKPVSALITDMSQPLGDAVGNALETAEAIRCLQGHGPDDLLEVVLLLSTEMLILGGKARDRAEARGALEALMASGQALEKFREMVEFQGGDPRVADDPSIMPSAPSVIEFTADRPGFITGFETDEIGRASNILGAGREKSSDTVDHSVGFIVRVRIGDEVQTGNALLEIHHRDGDGSLERCQAVLRDAIRLSDDRPDPPPLLHDTL